jgi:CP family cyanate transporter-like MFS transporter
MFAVAFTCVAALVATGWVATRERFVDDEVAARVPAVREPDAASRRG